MKLNNEECIPCKAGGVPLKGPELKEFKRLINPQWEVVEESLIKRSFQFKNFIQALDFVNKVVAIAESQGHHPDIEFGWGKAVIKFTTHKIGGLSSNDFIMAAKVDLLAK